MKKILEVKNITKIYKVYKSNFDRLKEIFINNVYHREFVSNDDISFDLYEGETLGIIGVNGAGLSVNIETIDNLIMVDEEAIFDITVKNEQEMSDQLTFLVTDLNWDWEKKFFTVSSGMTESFQLKLKAPKGVVGPDRYSLNLKIYSTSNDNI